MKKLIVSLLTMGIIILLTSCKKDETQTINTNVQGVAQKGPFAIGATVTISELTKNFSQTGKSFYSTIIDDNGSFEIPDVKFNSNYVQLRVDGSFFHEIRGVYTSMNTPLTSLADLNNSNTININIITHLEEERIKYLIENEGLSFNQAKEQAYSEILNIFSFQNEEIESAEQLNLMEDGVDNAKLLAISALFLNTSISPKSELLTNIKMDIKEDGVLNDNDIKTAIRTGAEFLKINDIGRNLKEHFDIDTVPDYQKYILQFIDGTDYTSDINVIIPNSFSDTINLFMLPNNSILKQDSIYCIAAEISNTIDHFDVRFEKESTVLWSISFENNDSLNYLIDDYGWNGEVYENTFWCHTSWFNKMAFLPMQFQGIGKVTLNFNYYSLDVGSAYIIREFTVE